MKNKDKIIEQLTKSTIERAINKVNIAPGTNTITFYLLEDKKTIIIKQEVGLVVERQDKVEL